MTWNMQARVTCGACLALKVILVWHILSSPSNVLPANDSPSSYQSPGMAVPSARFCKTFELGVEHGDWIPAEIKQKSFVCCGGAPNVSDVCNGRASRWTFRGSDNGRFAGAGGHPCVCDIAENTQRTVSRRERWVWKPRNCLLHAWDARDFCKRLGTRTILIVGDSYSDQFAATWMNMALPGGCAPQLICCMSDRLVNVSEGLGRGLHWRAYYDMHRPDIVMLAAGAHFHGSLAVYTSMLELVAPDIRQLRERHGTVFLWRTLQRPHRGCNKYTEPSEVRDANGLYNWRNFGKFDIEATREMNALGVPVIDMSPTILRPDAHPGHGDCSHYCLPGPLNTGVEMIYHRMIEDAIF